MIITNYILHPKQELFDVMRRTYLAGDHNILPYQDARISLQKISYRDVIPTQTFVLNSQIANIHNIYTQMMRNGINIFDLDSFLSYRAAQDTMSDTAFVLTPPIIEVIENQPLLIDGQHRITYTRDNNLTFNALIIENVAKEVYPYQLPLPDGWDAVQRFENKLPNGFVRKQRRYPTSEINKFFFREYPFPGYIKIMRAHSNTPENKHR